MIGFPLLLIPFAIVNIIAFLMPGVALGTALYTVPLRSGVAWTVTFSDVLVAFGMLLLFFEVAKAARPNGKYFTDHLLAILLFGGAVAEFVLLPQFGNTTFFFLTVLAFVDAISGIAIRVRQRAALAAASRYVRVVEPARVEPTVPPVRPQPQGASSTTMPPPQTSLPLDAPANDGVLELETPSQTAKPQPQHEPAESKQP